jgi:NADPH:quinone reductase-like Zn-dependent oxidoreductase
MNNFFNWDSDMSFVGKCKAAILEESGKPLVVRELSIPELSSGQVLVKVMFVEVS